MVYLKQQRPEKVTVPAVRQSKERGDYNHLFTGLSPNTPKGFNKRTPETLFVSHEVLSSVSVGPNVPREP